MDSIIEFQDFLCRLPFRKERKTTFITPSVCVRLSETFLSSLWLTESLWEFFDTI